MSEINEESLSKYLPFFTSLSKTKKDYILSQSRLRRLKRDSVICDIGEECGLIIVKRGRICAFSTTPEGRETALLTSYANDICLLALHGILDTTGLNVSVSAETDADIIIIDSAPVRELYRSNFEAHSFLSKIISESFLTVVDNMQNMLLCSPEQKIIGYLLSVSDRTGNTCVRTTHERIAKHAGTAREVVSRLLKRFSDQGYIEMQRGYVILKDKSALRRLQ